MLQFELEPSLIHFHSPQGWLSRSQQSLTSMNDDRSQLGLVQPFDVVELPVFYLPATTYVNKTSITNSCGPCEGSCSKID
jgi:hypothetical protein